MNASKRPAQAARRDHPFTVGELIAELLRFPVDAIVVAAENEYGALNACTDVELVRVKPHNVVWAPAKAGDPVGRLGVWMKTAREK